MPLISKNKNGMTEGTIAAQSWEHQLRVQEKLLSGNVTHKPLWVDYPLTDNLWQIIHKNKVSPVGWENVNQLNTRADSCVNKTLRAVSLVVKDVTDWNEIQDGRCAETPDSHVTVDVGSSNQLSTLIN